MVLTQADASLDIAFTRALFQRMRLCGLLLGKSITVEDLEKKESLAAAKKEPVKVETLTAAWLEDKRRSDKDGCRSELPAGGDLAELQARLQTQALQAEVQGLGSLLPVENPQALRVISHVRLQVKAILSLETAEGLDDAQAQWDEFKAGLTQLFAATRKSVQNLEAQWKKRFADAEAS